MSEQREGGAVTGHILRVPTHEYAREDLGVKWCFVCRKRRSFVLRFFTPDDPRSYYGPHSSVECERGHHDGDLFPGWTREYES